IANRIMASLDWPDRSRSAVSRRHRFSQANVRSTTHRFGRSTNPLAPSGRRTISRSRSLCSATHPYSSWLWYFWSAHKSRSRGNSSGWSWASAAGAARASSTPAPVTTTASKRPIVSTTMCRLRPWTFLWASYPRASPAPPPPHGVAAARPGARRRSAPPPPPHPLAQGVVDQLQGAVLAPLVEVPPDRALGRELPGEELPLAAGPQDVEDGVQDAPHGSLPRPAAGVDRNQVFDQLPLGIRQVAGVRSRSHPNDLGKSPPYRIGCKRIWKVEVLPINLVRQASASEKEELRTQKKVQQKDDDDRQILDALDRLDTARQGCSLSVRAHESAINGQLLICRYDR